MRRIGIFGGSFNPVHAGHLMVASYLAGWTGLDEIWLMLSPQNPLKPLPGGASDADRENMLRLATDGSQKLHVCTDEFSMPRPSYTINTLHTLAERYPNYRFTLIIGADNWLIFDRWREYDRIIEEFGVMIYPRPGYPIDAATLPDGVELTDAPVCSLSSTFLREAVASGRSIEHMVPPLVSDYINTYQLYINHESQQ